MAFSDHHAQLQKSIVVVHYLYPLLSLLYFFCASAISICTLQSLSLKVKDQHVRRDVILWLMSAVVLEYSSSAALVLVRTTTQSWTAEQDEIVYLLCSTIIWGVQVLILIESPFPVWYPYYVNWAMAIVVEGTLFVACHLQNLSQDPFNIAIIALQSIRLVTLTLLPYAFLRLRNRKENYDNDDEERQSLLRKRLAPKPGSSETTGNDYGSTDNRSDDRQSERAEEDSYLKRQRETKEKIAKRLENDGNWWTYAKGFSILFPYVWPIHSKRLQFRAVLVGGTLLATNALNILVPRQLGLVTDSLVGTNDRKPWVEVSIYAALAFVNSSACIGWIQFWLWQPLQQYSYDALSTAAHAHVMNLSSDFHETKEPSEINQAVFQGRSVAGLVDTICFSLIPMFIDLVLVFSYLYYLFGPYMALIPAFTTILYIYSTTKLVSMAVKRRRAYVTDFRKEWVAGYSSLGNWRVASYHSNIPYEEQRYDSSVKRHLKSERKYKAGARLVSACQGLIMTLGLLGCCYLAVYQVIHKSRTPGDFVQLLTYWSQLRGPLGFFSNMYKDISESMMDAERLLELFQTKPSIVDSKDAKPLVLGKGEISFHNVEFAYDSRKPTLKSVNFKVHGGTTVAIVGETGSGKSTILKLLDRFYDVTGGSIEIDGQNVRNVTLKSLRDSIGVVPQDPTLFSDSIMNNVRYARLTASDQEVYDACKAAAVHEKVMSFPDGYNSKVGTQGIKLSGGEQQRIAIARAILKQPEIILLDEATSSVDTETEQLIQEAFRTLCHGRTTFIVAHRLSTIIRADRIMVVKGGEIIEHGSHEELIHAKGKYHDLWSKQILVRPTKEVSGSAPRSASRSRSPRKREAVILNDMEPERPETELARALRTTKLSEGACDDLKQPEKGVSPNRKSKVDRISSTGTEHTPKLKPDAPEFIPRRLCLSNDASDDISGKAESKSEAKERHSKEKGQKKEDRRVQHGSIKKLAKKFSKKPEEQDAMSFDSFQNGAIRSDCDKNIVKSTSPGSQLAGTAASDATEELTHEEKSEKSNLRRPRFGRRFQAKSEPASKFRDSMDGTQDSDTNVISSSEGQPLLGATGQERRRVSAPSDPPGTSQDMRASVHGGRVKRPRHWRVKNRAAETGSATTSGPTSSQDTSNDEPTPPNAPTTSPAERGNGSNQPSVSFAPGI